ncbi:unnamed protein product, partial [Amoebophrya sp. A25]
VIPPEVRVVYSDIVTDERPEVGAALQLDVEIELPLCDLVEAIVKLEEGQIEDANSSTFDVEHDGQQVQLSDVTNSSSMGAGGALDTLETSYGIRPSGSLQLLNSGRPSASDIENHGGNSSRSVELSGGGGSAQEASTSLTGPGDLDVEHNHPQLRQQTSMEKSSSSSGPRAEHLSQDAVSHQYHQYNRSSGAAEAAGGGTSAILGRTSSCGASGELLQWGDQGIYSAPSQPVYPPPTASSSSSSGSSSSRRVVTKKEPATDLP